MKTPTRTARIRSLVADEGMSRREAVAHVDAGLDCLPADTREWCGACAYTVDDCHCEEWAAEIAAELDREAADEAAGRRHYELMVMRGW